jgi:hypothetical protein
VDDSQETNAIPAQGSAATGASQAEGGSGPRTTGSEVEGGNKQKPRPVSLILTTMVIFYTIISIVWIVSAWVGKRPLYSSGPTLRRIGETYAVEITLIRADRMHLACASEQIFSGLHCGYRRPRVAWGGSVSNDVSVLRPYSTVEGEQLLGAGLWSQIPSHADLPSYRFSVLCSFRAVGAVRNASARWDVKGAFMPINKVWFVGSLSNCLIPK